MKTMLRVVLAATPLAAAGVLLTPHGNAVDRAGWMVRPAAVAAPAVCAATGLPCRAPAVADARNLLAGLAKFTSSRLETAMVGIGGPISAAGTGRLAAIVKVVVRSAGSGVASTGDQAAAVGSRPCQPIAR